MIWLSACFRKSGEKLILCMLAAAIRMLLVFIGCMTVKWEPSSLDSRLWKNLGRSRSQYVINQVRLIALVIALLLSVFTANGNSEGPRTT